MTQPAQVLPYAAADKPKTGMSLGTILAIFAVGQAVQGFLASPGLVGNLRYWMGSITSSAAISVVNWLHLASVLGLLAGAVLLLCRRHVGGIMVATVCVFEVLILAPLSVGIVASADVGRHLSPIQHSTIWAGVFLTWVAALTWVWVVCRLAGVCRQRPVIDGSGWSAARTACAWSVLVFGLCQCLAILAAVTALALEGVQRGVLYWLARPTTAAAVLLVVGGLGALLRRGRRLCIIAAVVWALFPFAGFIYDLWWNSDLTSALQFIDANWIGRQIEHVPVAILWILLLTHPQIRACWSSKGDQSMVQ